MDIVINSYGSALTRHKGMFRVDTDEGVHRLSPEKVSSFTIHAACTISSDALLLAIEHEIPMIFIGKSGKPQGRVWSHHLKGLNELRRKQLHFSTQPTAVHFIMQVLIDKAEGQRTVLKHIQSKVKFDALIKDTDAFLQARIDTLAQMISTQAMPDWGSLRGIEGSMSKVYFKALSDTLPKSAQFAGRSRQPSKDIFNATLNYLYGILYSKVETAIVAAGLDPFVAIMHRDDYDFPGFVFDLIECFRHWADQCTWNLLHSKTMRPQVHTHEIKDGIWLNEDGRIAAFSAFNEFLHQDLKSQGKRLKREARFIEQVRSYVQLI